MIDEVKQEITNTIKTKANSECDKFDSMIFDDLDSELKDIAEWLKNYMVYLSYFNTVTKESIEQIKEHLSTYQKRFEVYKKSKTKYLTQLFLKDKWLRLCFGIFAITVLLTIISMRTFK